MERGRSRPGACGTRSRGVRSCGAARGALSGERGLLRIEMLSRRVLLSALPLLMATSAYAQNFPAGQVRIVVPFPPGGATDVLGRVLAAHLQALWGQTVISDYRPGAAGLIGTRQVIGAPADGHTLLMASTGAILALAGGQKAITRADKAAPW